MEAKDYDTAIESVRRARDEAIHQADQLRIIAREIIAMEKLGMSISLFDRPIASKRWKYLLDLAKANV